MTRLLIPILAAATLALGCQAGPASAAPVPAVALVVPDTVVQEVRTSRRMRRHRMMRRGRMAAPSQAGNARDPSRPVGQQLQGNTTGGPRY